MESGDEEQGTPLLGVSVQNAILVALSTEHRGNQKRSFFMSQYILKRNNKYLNERYQWTPFPCAFQWWHFQDILPMAMQFRDRPLMIGEMRDGTLENTIWTKA